MNIIDRFKNLKFYCEVLDNNRDELYNRFNVKIDDVYRLYTVYTISEQEFNTYGGVNKVQHSIENVSSLFKANNIPINKSSGALINGVEYFDQIVNIKKSELGTFLDSIGLTELYGMTSMKKIDNLNRQMIVEYKFLKTTKLYKMFSFLIFSGIFSLIVGTILATVIWIR